MSARTRRRFELIGWVTFVASAAFYLVAGLRAGDALSIMGSVLFFVACIFFLAPMLRRARRSPGRRARTRATPARPFRSGQVPFRGV